MSSKPVKLTQPSLSQVYPRTRLFDKIDSLHQSPIIWVSAPGGAGKTTLVASYLQARNITPLWYQIDQGDSDLSSFFYYLGEGVKQLNHSRKRVLPLLTPESQFGIPVFSRNFFRKLFEKIKSPTVLVLDNFELVNDDVAFNEILQQGLEEIPPGCQVIITGRALPPTQYATMIAKNQLALIDWDELQLTQSESSGVVKLLTNENNHSNEVLKSLHQSAQGWISGLILFNQFYKSSGHTNIAAIISEETSEKTLQHSSFDYFAGEIFNRLHEETQIFLLKTAWLSKIQISTAKQLTGISHTKKILNDLHQRQMFTTRCGLFKPTYIFHPLFKKFLQECSRESFSEAEISQLKNSAAQILIDEQNIEEAANLLIQTENSAELKNLIIEHAETLTKQGRFKLLQSWLDQLPETDKNNSPWLMYWCGSTELMYTPLVAKTYFEKAYHLFDKTSDARGNYLSWLGIMDSTYYAHDSYQDVPKWIDELACLRKRHPRYPSLEIKGRITFNAFFLQLKGCPEHTSFDIWLKKSERLQRFIPNTSIRCMTGAQLSMYYTFYTQTTKLKLVSNSLTRLAESDTVAPLARILAYCVIINRGWLTAETSNADAIVSAALKVSHESGVYVAHVRLLSSIVMHYLTKQDIANAEKYLEEFQQHIQHSQRGDMINYHYLAGWLAYQKQDIELAYEHTRIAYQDTPALHMPFFELLIRCVHIFMLIEVNKLQTAKTHIEEAKTIASAIKNDSMGIFYLGILQAWLAYKLNQPTSALPHLQAAFAYGRKKELAAVPWHVPEMLSPLCAIALANEIEVDYVRSFIQKNELRMPAEAHQLSAWPMPVRVFTLGNFKLEISNPQSNQTSNGMNKPCELLCALIAFGGQDVNDSKLEEALWPNAEGDAAHRALITNLQRLRNLLGMAKAIQYHDGKLSLDARYCWVDAWAFERGILSHDAKQVDHAISLYQGNFLQSEGDPIWLLATRENLRQRYLQQVDKLGRSLANDNQWQAVVACYNRGLKIDNLYEAYYQQLLNAHRQLGQTNEVIRVYRQCQKQLQAQLGTAPSRQTTALFESLSQ